MKVTKKEKNRIIEALLRDEKHVEVKGIEIELPFYKLKTLKTYARKREKEALKRANEIIKLIEE